MKKTVRILCFVLALVMAVSLLSVSAFAGSESNVREYNGYLAFGSSITRGYGLDGYYNDNVAANMQIEGSYPKLVADACNVPLENRYCATYGGFTASATLVLLGEEPDFTDEYDVNNFETRFKRDMVCRYCTDEQKAVLSRYTGIESSIVGAKPIDEIIAQSDLISLEYGIQDTVFRAGSLAGYMNFDFKNATTEEIAGFAEAFLSEIDDGNELLFDSLHRIIDHIIRVNPDATIVLLGSFNPLANLSLKEDMVLPLGSILSSTSALLNSQYKVLAEEYDNVVYCDVSNVDTYATEDGTAILSEGFFAADGGGASTHPSANGLRYMAHQILSVLPEVTETSKTDISVHMGIVKQVSSVVLDGIPVNNYTMEDSVLTIPYSFKTAKSLTVTTVNEDGTTGTYIYQLSYNDGYTAYRIYSTNDNAVTAKKAINSVVNICKTIVNKLGSLFSK